MTSLDFYPPREMVTQLTAEVPYKGVASLYEQSPHASEPSVDARRSSAPSGDLPVTPEEEEAWLDKLKQLAGCVV